MRNVKNPCYVGCTLAMLFVNNYSGYGGETRENGREILVEYFLNLNMILDL